MWPVDPLQLYVPDTARLATIRHGVAAVAEEWEVADVDGLVLLVHELAANGLDHGRGPVRIDLVPTGEGDVHVEVHDSGPGDPHVATPEPDAERGRGLALVEQLADEWGVTREPGGKTVWAEFGHHHLVAA